MGGDWANFNFLVDLGATCSRAIALVVSRGGSRPTNVGPDCSSDIKLDDGLIVIHGAH